APARSSSGCARRPLPLSVFENCSIAPRRADSSEATTLSSLEQAHDLSFSERVEMQVEADNSGRGIGFHVDLVGLHRKHREQIAVRMVAFRRARPAITGHTEIRACLQRPGRHFSTGAAGANLKLGHVRWN